ncbi:MAG: hypothetical protein A2Z39_02050 [Deltaproteobacteria bacterium RBG_19FT_COMBO_46_9]|nr:MAG: hypothetical protein A2Z39_02050 [Deltaproteobacteria bacterium RBG_19FT_COMBO_46_9]
MGKIFTGLDRFREEYWKKMKGLRLGLLSNQASLDSRLTHAREIISCILPGQLKALFGPQHGYGGEDQDNMIETGHSTDMELNIPVFSLYSKYREPLTEMFELIDALIIDLQDVGTRVYTFASTMLNCLRAAKKSRKKVIILDRPNPLGGEIIEGNLLSPELYSFVGPFILPMRHGFTMGELAMVFDQAFKIESDMEIVPMQGWERKMIWHDTGLRWIMPSPNMPLSETAYVYPGQVIWEGTNLSEGRGTCRPFEIFGAPFLDTKVIRKRLIQEAMEGCHLQEITFRPTFNKWEGKLCKGFMIHVLDYRAYLPYFTSISLLKTIIDSCQGQFQWKEPPYEYEYERMPIDLILGDSELRRRLETGGDLLEIKEGWLSKIKDFMEWRRPYLLY